MLKISKQTVEATMALNELLYDGVLPPPYSTHVSQPRWEAMVKRIAIDLGVSYPTHQRKGRTALGKSDKI